MTRHGRRHEEGREHGESSEQDSGQGLGDGVQPVQDHRDDDEQEASAAEVVQAHTHRLNVGNSCWCRMGTT